MQGTALAFPQGIAFLGNSQHFLRKRQINLARIKRKASENNYHSIITRYFSCSEARVDFVLNPTPQKCYPDLFPELFESSVERNLEKMFDVDS